MADSDVSTVVASSPGGQSPVKKEKKAKNPRSKPTHPPTSEMVTNAIKGLKERGGSSLQAIKKYIAANYKVDAEKVAPFIKKYLKGAVASGTLVQTKGKGASGSFKLAASATGAVKQASGENRKTSATKPKKPAKKTSGEKTKTTKSTPKARKSTAEKKAVKKATEKKVAKTTTAASASEKPKSPSKAKKSNKAGPTKKPKAPKPKSAKSPSKAKKASPKKKK